MSTKGSLTGQNNHVVSAGLGTLIVSWKQWKTHMSEKKWMNFTGHRIVLTKGSGITQERNWSIHTLI